MGIKATIATKPKPSINGLLISIASDIATVIERRIETIIGPVTTPPASIAIAKNRGLQNLDRIKTNKYPGIIKYSNEIPIYILMNEKTTEKQRQLIKTTLLIFYL